MGLLTPEGLTARLEEAAAAREVTWLFDPHPAQQEMLDAEERFLAAACGRRFGKSLVALRWIVREVIERQGLGWWVAPTYAASMRAWGDMMKLLPRKYRTVYKGDRRVELNGGGAIEFKSADNPDNLRGAGLVAAVFDEAAYIDDYVHDDVVAPMMLTTEGREFVISTPRAKKGWFYQMFRNGQQGRAGYRSWQLPTAINPHVKPQEIARLRETLPDSVYRREILAEFLDQLNSVFGNVRAVATATPIDGVAPVAIYVLGGDWGRQYDYTVVVALQDLGNGRARMVGMDRWTGLRYSAQIERFKAFVARFDPISIIAEQNSMGGPLVERLQEDGLPVTGFSTTASTKVPLIQQLQLAIGQGHIELLNDPVLIAEFEDYEEDVTATGLPTFNAPPRQHDDTIIAVALAWRGIAGEPGGDRAGHFEGRPETFLGGAPIAPSYHDGPFGPPDLQLEQLDAAA